MAYNGAVNGVNILHGVAVEPEVVSRLPGQQERISTLGHPRATEPGQDIEVEAVIQHAIRVIGNREQAMRWLGTPVRALNYATPIARVHDGAGREQVLSVLTNLEHGVL